MKKIMIALMAMFLMVGCADFNIDEGAVQTELRDVLGVTDGLSAYEVAVENGYEGTETDWLNSLRGEAGVQGVSGLDGLSAYQLWIIAGNEGTEEDFILSLQGLDGAPSECDCLIPIPQPIPDPIIADGNVTMLFTTRVPGISNIQVGHYRNSMLVSISDGEVTDDNGTLTIKGLIEVTEEGEHAIGITFTK